MTLRKPTILSNELAGALEAQIRAGDYPAGTKLPSEAQLCARYGISRNVVREALARLKSSGLVESRQGAGVFVLSASAHQSFRIVTSEGDRLALRKLFELRLEVEVAAASMAARRRQSEQLTRLEQLLLRLTDNPQPLQIEQQMQECVAEASGNEYLSGFLAYLNGADRLADGFLTVWWSQHRADLIRHWQQIIAAIRLGDPDLARREYWRYLLDSAEGCGIRGLQGWERTRMSNLAEPFAPLCAAPDAGPRRPRLPIPLGACDCHMHVFWPELQRPFTPHRSYTPPPSSLQDYMRVMDKLGLSRAVVVQPSVYGTDNHVTLETLRQGGDRFRGVVVIDPDTPMNELLRMHALGVRGVRINLLFKSGVAVSDVRTLAAKVAPLGWHLQILLDVSEFSDIEASLGRLPVPVVIDHMGHLPPEFGPQHPGFVSMLRLLERGQLWVKLSGAERISADRWPYIDVRPLAETLLATNPERLLWASDWPHTCLPGAMPNDGDLLDLLGLWTDNPALQHRVLVDNPALLYGFEPIEQGQPVGPDEKVSTL
ncbi:amidohydrolase family protein [Pokkaliibacter plantistimulans]|uniref:amidohydrolase family protein n=1 Tax=Pokkaliibacter plantistimulans TaxID=1635171 RepID=UPI001FAFC986|nr:amidohydrolase family protein [Pokkaliibacter plantistimulans]